MKVCGGLLCKKEIYYVVVTQELLFIFCQDLGIFEASRLGGDIDGV